MTQSVKHSIFSGRLAGAIVLVAATVPRVGRLGVFTAPDEQFIWDAANQFALAVRDGRFADTVTIIYPGIPALWIETIAAWVRVAWQTLVGQPIALEAALGMDTPLTLLAEKRLALAVAHIVLVMLIWRVLRRLFNDPVALLAGLLLALDPFLLAESRVMRMEALNTELIVLSVLWLALAMRAPGRRWPLIASGVAAGLAVLTKMSSLYLAIFVAAALPVAAWTESPGRWRAVAIAALKRFAVWAVSAGATFVALWPAFLFAPAKAIQFLWDYVSRVGDEGVIGSGVFFWGQVFPDDPGLWFYPVATAFRVGPLVLPGLVLLAGWFLVRKKKLPAGWGQSMAVLVAFAVSYIGFMSLIALKYDRYALPIFPALDALAALGLWLAARRILGERMGWRVALPVAVVAAQVAVIWPVRPYYYPYYNSLLGGIQTAAGAVRVGYTEGWDMLGAYLSAQPNAENLAVASAKSKDLQYFFPGQTIPLANTDGAWVQADYVFLYVSQMQRQKHRPEIVAYLHRHEPVYRVVINKFVYGELYPGPAAEFYANSKLEGRGWLLGYTLSDHQVSAGRPLTVTTYFRNEGQLPTDRFFARLTDIDGYVWAEAAVSPRPGFETAFDTRKEIVEGEARLNVPPGALPGDYTLQMGFDSPATGEAIGQFTLPATGDDVRVEQPADFPELALPAEATPVDLTLADELSLAGFTLADDGPSARWLTLYWQAVADVRHDYVLALQLLDAGGEEVAFWLGRPARSSQPTNEWRQGRLVQDPWRLDVPPGEYTLALTVFDAATTEQVAAITLQTLQVER